MQKKGQIALFVIIGIILAGAAFFTYYLSLNNEKTPEVESPTQILQRVDPVSIFVEDCLKKTLKDALILVEAQGGIIYIDNTVLSAQSVFGPVAYWKYEDLDVSPSYDDVARQIDRYIDEFLGECTNNFAQFSFNIDEGTPQARTIIEQDSEAVVVNLNYPLTFNGMTVSDFRATYPVRLGKILYTATAIKDMEMVLKHFADPDFLSKLDLDIAMFPQEGNTIIYSITDKESTIDDFYYTFFFASKFEEEYSG